MRAKDLKTEALAKAPRTVWVTGPQSFQIGSVDFQTPIGLVKAEVDLTGMGSGKSPVNPHRVVRFYHKGRISAANLDALLIAAEEKAVQEEYEQSLNDTPEERAIIQGPLTPENFTPRRFKALTPRLVAESLYPFSKQGSTWEITSDIPSRVVYRRPFDNSQRVVWECFSVYRNSKRNFRFVFGSIDRPIDVLLKSELVSLKEEIAGLLDNKAD